jgi:D-serine deaminase-like pyridoxal phosphate-dependent protein
VTSVESLDPAAYGIPTEDRERILSPALVIFLDQVRANLRTLLGYVDGNADRLRPHIKTTKLPRVFVEIARAGIRHYKCATTREAEQLLTVLEAQAVAGDLLVAYGHLEPALSQLTDLATRFPRMRVSVLCEDADLVDAIPDSLGIFVDVNPGMNRTGIEMSRRDAILAVAERAEGRFRGIHHYEGHIHAGSFEERQALAIPLHDALIELVEATESAGCPVGEVVTSGTPSFRAALMHDGLDHLAPRHRVSPGTVVYSDLRTQSCEELDFVPAALVFSRVIAHPGPALVTVDAGSKAIAAEAGAPIAEALGFPHLAARTPSEEHLPFDAPTDPPPLGTPILLVPRHVCPTVNLAEEAVLVEGGRVIGIAPVSARAHDIWVGERP